MTELTSWKEIATHLGVSVRTAQMWEAQRGLPVRRLPGPRGRVLATTTELDLWKLSGTGPAAALPLATPGVASRKWWIAAGAVAVLAGGLVVIGRQGQRPVELSSFDPAPFTSGLGQEMKPSLSADGTQVAYLERAEGASDFSAVVHNLATGQKRIVLRGLSVENAVDWSPDGERLAFTRFEGGRALLSLVPANGGAVRDLLDLRGADRVFNAMESLRTAWMAGGREICFSDRDQDGEALGLFLADAQSGKRRRLTLAPGGIPGDVQCAPSPDGKSVAFVRQQTVSEGDVYLMDVATGQQRRITRMSGHFMGLAWLPGKQGLLAGCEAGTAGSSIWHISTEGLEARRLTGQEVAAAYPSAAPGQGGVRVIYQVIQRDINVWRWSAEGGMKRVTDSVLLDHYPAVNRNGELAWISRRTGPPEVWTAGPNGENPRRLTYLEGPYVDFPRWSADGRFVAFAFLRDGSRDVFLMDRQTNTMDPIAGLGTEEGRASFSQDGRHVYFRSDRSGVKEIWRSPLTGNLTLARMTEGGGYEGFEDPTGQWLYYVRERDKGGLWRMRVDGGKGMFVAKDVWEGRWAIGPDGIYILRGRGKHSEVARMGWMGGEAKMVMEMAEGKTAEAGLAVSADGKTIYWAQCDRIAADLMTVSLR